MDKEPGSSTIWWAAAAGAIGHGLFIADIDYSARGLAWVTFGTILAWAGLFVPIRVRREKLLSRAVVAGVLAWQIQQLYAELPPVLRNPPAAYYTLVVPLLGLTAAGALLWDRLSKRVFIPLFLATFFVSGAWMLRLSPHPPIDVFDVTRQACQAISSARNPFAIRFPTLLPDDLHSTDYPPGYVVDGQVMLGYPYMPLSLAVAYAGHLLTGDYRMGNLLALTAAGGFLTFVRRGVNPAAGVCLMLTTPKIFKLLDLGWSEPAAVLCLAAVIFCASRARQALPWVAGLLLVSKQYVFLAAGVMPLLRSRKGNWRGSLIKAATAMTVTTAPLVLWDFRAFWYSAVHRHLHGIFRVDSLNFAATWVRSGHTPPPGWVSIALAAVALGVVQLARRFRRDRADQPAVFAGALAAVLLVFFALARGALLNYYFFVVAALCCAISAEGEGEPSA